MTAENDERLDAIAKAKGIRLEDITVQKNEGAPDGYGYGAWVSLARKSKTLAVASEIGRLARFAH